MYIGVNEDEITLLVVTVPHAQLEPNRCKVAIGYRSESESATLRTSCIPSLQAKIRSWNVYATSE